MISFTNKCETAYIKDTNEFVLINNSFHYNLPPNKDVLIKFRL